MSGESWQSRIRSRLYPAYAKLPEGVQTTARTVFKYLNGPLMSARTRWIRREYNEFGLDERRRIFMNIAHFAHVNRPIAGFYLEFGCHEANTMRTAYDCFRHLFDWQYVAFDSFEGLPEIAAIDKQPIWEKGKLKTSECDFVEICLKHGMPRNRLTTVKGFYHQSLNQELRERLLPGKAAVIYIDCDLYESTVPVLSFIKDFLQPGTVVVFDDWNCFLGNPERGERRAWREFQESEPHLRFEAFVQTGMQMSFIFIGGNELQGVDIALHERSRDA